MSPIDEAIEDLKSQESPAFRSTAHKYQVDHQTLRRRFLGIQLLKAEYYET